MSYRKLYHIFEASSEKVGNMEIRRALPARGLRNLSPFLLIDHMGPKDLPAGEQFEVPAHPHAGFQTVTYFLAGSGLHIDSLGHRQVIKPGDVNWMTAGKGIVHAEYSDPDFEKTGGRLEGFQVWVDLPDEHRDEKPDFGSYQSSDLPEVTGEAWWARVVAGSFGNARSPVKTFSAVLYLHFRLQPGAEVDVPLELHHNAMVYAAIGDVNLNAEHLVKEGNLAVMAADDAGPMIKLMNTGREETELLVLAGEPLAGSHVSYGPFIARNVDHLQEQVRRYEAGEMGKL